MLCQCYSCVATIQSDVNCTSKWVLHSVSAHQVASGSTLHDHADGFFTSWACQKACEFDPRCVAVDYLSVEDIALSDSCYLNTKPNHNHSIPSKCAHEPLQPGYSYQCWNHYDLVSRCNITSGQCFHSKVVVVINVLKPN